MKNNPTNHLLIGCGWSRLKPLKGSVRLLMEEILHQLIGCRISSINSITSSAELPGCKLMIHNPCMLGENMIKSYFTKYWKHYVSCLKKTCWIREKLPCYSIIIFARWVFEFVRWVRYFKYPQTKYQEWHTSLVSHFQFLDLRYNMR